MTGSVRFDSGFDLYSAHVPKDPEKLHSEVLPTRSKRIVVPNQVYVAQLRPRGLGAHLLPSGPTSPAFWTLLAQWIAIHTLLAEYVRSARDDTR